MTQYEPGLPSLHEETGAAFQRLLLSLADSKRILGIRYSDWLLGAPSIEAGIAASSMAQDEWGHARLLYATLKDFDVDPVQLEHDRPASDYASVDVLDRPLEDWAEVIAAVMIVDGALAVALEGLLEGGYASIEGRIGKMLGEEEFHASLGTAWFRRIAGGNEVGRTRLTEAARAMIPATLRFLAPDDEPHGRLAEAGLTLPAPRLRARFQEMVGPSLELVQVEEEAASIDDGSWDPARGRGEGHPGEEAVERARGDRNRELFVE